MPQLRDVAHKPDAHDQLGVRTSPCCVEDGRYELKSHAGDTTGWVAAHDLEVRQPVQLNAHAVAGERHIQN